MSATTRTLIAVVGALLAAGQALAAPDLDGVWRMVDPPAAIKTTEGKAPPLLPAARKLYAQRLARRAMGDNSFDLSYRCKPPGEPRLFYEKSVPFQIVQSDKRIVFLFQWNRLVRVVEMKPPRPLVGPSYMGQSAGAWDGDTLVVDVIGLHDDTFLDPSGLPHSEDAHLTERFRRKDADTLEARISVEDPKTFAAPWETTATFKRTGADQIREDVCIERMNLVGKLALPEAPKR